MVIGYLLFTLFQTDFTENWLGYANRDNISVICEKLKGLLLCGVCFAMKES